MNEGTNPGYILREKEGWRLGQRRLGAWPGLLCFLPSPDLHDTLSTRPSPRSPRWLGIERKAECAGSSGEEKPISPRSMKEANATGTGKEGDDEQQRSRLAVLPQPDTRFTGPRPDIVWFVSE